MDLSLLFMLSLLQATYGFLLENIDNIQIFVSPNGLDGNSGEDVLHPYQTLHKAVSRISDPNLKGKDVFINLLTGYHDLGQTLAITHTDSRRVTIRAYQDQDVHVTGGKRIESKYFHPVTDHTALNRLPIISRTKVLQVTLGEVGITDLGVLSDYGFYIQRTAPLEIFENGKPLTLARYPNHDYVNIDSVTDNSSKGFTYASDRPKTWHGEGDLWVHGFWGWSWADRAIKVQNIDVQHRSITLAKPALYGLKLGHFNATNPAAMTFSQQGGYFKFVNVMSELDEPGEYYVDRNRGILYLWPKTDKPYQVNDTIYASVINTCITINQGSSNIVLEGFTIEACRQYGILGNSVHNVTITRMRIKNTGTYGIRFSSSNGIKVLQSDIRYTDGGIDISGGVRSTLTPSRNEISDNTIAYFGRMGLVGSDGISCGGVGNHIHHNTLWKGSYTGVHWNGNDQVFEYNHISEMCLNASDCGAMMTGRDWTFRGNVIRLSHIQNTKRLHPGADVRGIMLDDQYSSVLIERNVFRDNDVHVNIGGGRDNIVRQNIFYNTFQYSIQVDHRGDNWGHVNDNELIKALNNVPINSTLWRQRYPELATIYTNHKELPIGNKIYENVFYSLKKEMVNGDPKRADWFNISNNLYTSEEHNFYAPSFGDYRPTCLLTESASWINFPDPVLPSSVGPRYRAGPSHMNEEQPALGYKTGKAPLPQPCTTKAPSVAPPHSYLPDGSFPNTLYSVSKVGCWFAFDKCSNHAELQRDHRNASDPYYRDVQGEQHDNSGTSEKACLSKVATMVTKCGQNSAFAVIYGPTGAMTLGGEGCFFAQYGCPKFGDHNTGFIRDSYAEKTQNAAHDENACLSRAFPQWIYCGGNYTYPYTSIYRPTGNIRVAGGGCWIKLEKCPSDSSLSTMFYDGWGASNLLTDEDEESCFRRAEYYWRHCGSDTQYAVTAYFRPHGKSSTFP